jgi:hypothetical protein
MALKNICSYKCRVSLFKPPSGGFFIWAAEGVVPLFGHVVLNDILNVL